MTLGIGGNDFGIFSSLVGCAPGGARACPPGLQQRVLRDAGRVEGRVARAVRQVAERAPEAAVYVVGYPQVLPAEDGCSAVPLPAGQLETAASRGPAPQRLAACGAEAAGATYVDLDEASEGHDVCAGTATRGSTVPRCAWASRRPSTRCSRACEGWPRRSSAPSPATRRPRPRRRRRRRDAVVRNEVAAG